MNIDQIAMCYISMDSSQLSLQTNDKCFSFQISNSFSNYWPKTEEYSSNNKVGEAFVLISTCFSVYVFFFYLIISSVDSSIYIVILQILFGFLLQIRNMTTSGHFCPLVLIKLYNYAYWFIIWNYL